MGDAMLQLKDLEAGYGHAALVLRGISIEVRAGEIACLIGPNGAGKSTVLRVASGLLRPRSGAVILRDRDVSGMPPHKLLRQGMSHVLQGHSVFPEMTVAENVRMGGYTLKDRKLLEEREATVRDHFPVIAERWKTPAGLLSGGQQKMVEFGRSMMLDPDVLLLDEPSCGLEPRSMATVFEEIGRLRDLGKAVLLVEQNARSALGMADRGCVLDLGRVRIEGSARELLDDPELGSLYLGGAPKSADDPADDGAASGRGQVVDGKGPE
ncbi:MAG: ABC transporter ATP-binding protein [Actinomycetota bacterium]